LHSGVAKEISADGQRRLQRAKEIRLLLRQGFTQLNGRAGKRTPRHARLDVHAKRTQRVGAAEPPPVSTDARVVEKRFKQSLMVSFEGDIAPAEWIAQQPIEHAARVRATVDIVAERDDKRIAGMFFDVGVDARDHSLEKIETAMNVADGIDAVH